MLKSISLKFILNKAQHFFSEIFLPYDTRGLDIKNNIRDIAKENSKRTERKTENHSRKPRNAQELPEQPRRKIVYLRKFKCDVDENENWFEDSKKSFFRFPRKSIPAVYKKSFIEPDSFVDPETLKKPQEFDYEKMFSEHREKINLEKIASRQNRREVYEGKFYSSLNQARVLFHARVRDYKVTYQEKTSCPPAPPSSPRQSRSNNN